MKKTYNYIIAAAIVLTSMLHLVSCKDSNNDWTTDPSVIQQRPPTSLTVEVDSATLNLTVQIGTIANAAYYELQMSESPLPSNADIPVEGEIYTFNNITDNAEITITRKNEQCEIKDNTTYYFRVRAIGNDGTVSNWYTNGMLYYGGIGDEKTAKRMLENSCYKVDTPMSLWINDYDVEPDALTTSWYISDYYTISKIRNETLGTEISASDATQNPNYTKVKVWYYKWEGLEVNKTYTFSLIDDAGNVISSITKATETAPDESISFFLGSFPTFTNKAKDFELNSTDANGNKSELFKGKFIIGGQMKTEQKTNSDNPYIYPFDKSIFLPLSPGIKTKDSTNKYNRISTGGSSSSIELDIPASGRLYLYVACEKGVVKLSQGSEEEGTLQEVTLKSPAKITKPSTQFTKGYVEKGKATLSWTASTYICGIHFVPWEAVKSE